jgi:3D (Asp-Asp-Asp) domain-containing protein
MTALVAALLLAQSWCQPSKITGYWRYGHGTHTYDGTSILADEAIAAASWNIPMGSRVWIEDYGTVRVADRGGGLGSTGWIDVAVWDRSAAYRLTSTRTICVYPPASRAP